MIARDARAQAGAAPAPPSAKRRRVLDDQDIELDAPQDGHSTSTAPHAAGQAAPAAPLPPQLKRFVDAAAAVKAIPDSQRASEAANKLLGLSDPAAAMLAYTAAQHRLSEAALSDIIRCVIPVAAQYPSAEMSQISQKGSTVSVSDLWTSAIAADSVPSFDPIIAPFTTRSGKLVSVPIWSLTKWLTVFFANKELSSHLVVRSGYSGHQYGHYTTGTDFKAFCNDAQAVDAFPVVFEISLDDTQVSHKASLAPLFVTISNLDSTAKGLNRFVRSFYSSAMPSADADFELFPGSSSLSL